MVFQKKFGYTNPFRHLQSCLEKGDTATLMRIFEEKEKGNLQSDLVHFTPLMKLCMSIHFRSKTSLVIFSLESTNSIGITSSLGSSIPLNPDTVLDGLVQWGQFGDTKPPKLDGYCADRLLGKQCT